MTFFVYPIVPKKTNAVFFFFCNNKGEMEMTTGYRPGSSSMRVRQQPRRELERSLDDENFILAVVDDIQDILRTSANDCDVQARMIGLFGENFYNELVEGAVKEIRSRKMRMARVGGPMRTDQGRPMQMDRVGRDRAAVLRATSTPAILDFEVLPLP